MAEQGHGNGRSNVFNDARLYFGAILAVIGIGGTYVIGFINSLEDRFVTAREFNAQIDVISTKISSVADDVRDLKPAMQQIPRLSAQVEEIRKELDRQRQEDKR